VNTRSFFQVVLRTLDVDAARRFYAGVLGEGSLTIFQLHTQAVERGARPHWLGHLQVPDVDAAVATFSARGATPLGPKWINPEGLEAAVMRDPGGAVVSLAKPSAQNLESAQHLGPDLLWSLLNTQDVESAKRNYAELVGWVFATPLDLGPLGVFHPFALEPGGAPVGSMIDIAGRSGVHTHWLFHFRVSELEAAVAAVQSLGGIVADRVTLPNGDRIAICDDDQGAAFTLRQPRG